MPKIDPITGCEVMTFMEFAQAEGKEKGQSAGEWMEDLFADMARENERESERWTQPEMYPDILEELRRCIALELREWKSGRWSGREKNDPHYMDDWPRPPTPVEIVTIEDSDSKGGFKGSSHKLTGIVRCKDGKLRRFHHNYESWYGDFYEPPGDDWELTWEEIEEKE